MTSVQHPGRALAVVGAMVAVGATTLMALAAGTAVADEPGRCEENVNVRAEPSVDSEIVGLCEAGTEVQVGESSDGFVRLTNDDFDGWSAQEFVSVNGEPPAEPARTGASSSEPTTTSSSDEPTTSSSDESTTSSSDDESSDLVTEDTTAVQDDDAPVFRAPTRDADPAADRVAPQPTPTPEPEPEGSLLGELPQLI